MPATLTLQQWANSLSEPAWIEMESSADLVAKINSAVASLDAGAHAESKPLLTPIPVLQGVSRFQTPPINLLHALSKITAPPVPNLAAFSASWAERRYIWVFDPDRPGPDPWLRLSSFTERLDFHQKTLLSADLGVAVACYVMETFFPIAETADATSAVELKTKGAFHVGRKWPDLVCTEATGPKGYIVECKGSGSGWQEVKRQLVQGTRQVTSVRLAPGTPTDRFVLATEIQEDRFKVHAIDPPGDEEVDEADQHAEVSLDTADVRRLSGARTLSYCGDYPGALELLAPFEWEEYPKMESVEAQLSEIEIEAGSFVGLADVWLTPTGKRIEVFRGLERRARERLLGRPLATENQQPFPPAGERRIHYQATSHTRDRVHEVISACADGTVLVIRLSEG